MDPINIPLQQPEVRRVFHDNVNTWSAIWRCRVGRMLDYDYVGLGDWHLNHLAVNTSVPTSPVPSRHDKPIISAQDYSARPGRLIICDMPYTGADINNSTDYRSNITRMARYTRSSYMESRGQSLIDINCWISSSLSYVYVQLQIHGRLVEPSPPLTRTQIPVAEVLDQDGTLNDTPRFCWSHDGNTLPDRGVTPYLFRDMPVRNDWTDAFMINPSSPDEVFRHNWVWMPQHVTCWNGHDGWAS